MGGELRFYHSPMHLIVLMPCFDDAVTASELMTEVHEHARKHGHTTGFLLMDDGSEKLLAESVREQVPQPPFPVSVLRLKKNVGHQRAIACGLCHLVESKAAADAIVVMDSDGEDRPADVPALVEPIMGRSDQALVVFAQRARRSENLVFRAGYQFYLGAHRLLVGQAPRVGNFSAITLPVAQGLVVDSNLWSHYAATIWTSRYKRILSPIHRGKRRRGKSKLSYGSLVLHGLAAISCYRETLAVRMLLGSGILFAATLAVFITVSIACWEDRTTTAGLAVLSAGLGACMTLQLCILALWQCLNTLQKRHQATFMPMRDYCLFIEKLTVLEQGPVPASAATANPLEPPALPLHT